MTSMHEFDLAAKDAITFMLWWPEPFQINDRLGKVLESKPRIETAAQWLVVTHLTRQKYPNWQLLFDYTEAKCIEIGIDPSDLLGGLGKFEF